MTYKWDEKKKAQIEKIFCGWLNCLYLMPMYVAFEWREKDEDHRKDAQPSQNVAAMVEVGFPYRSVNLILYPNIADVSDEHLDYLLLHEALHVVLQPICRNRMEETDVFRDNMEMVTEHIAQYIHSCKRFDNKQRKKIRDLSRSKSKHVRRKK